MNPFRNLGLLSKVNIIIAIILLGFFALSTFFTYRQQRSFIIDESIEKARIIAAEAIQAREYISQQLQIGDIPLSEERYGMIPVVASNRIGELVARDLDYRIRQVSNRYRNPKNAPDDFESEMLDRFYASPYVEEEYAITSVNGERVFRYMQPFRAEESCLECHGDPADAPDYIKRLFPEDTDQAYNYKIGQTIGAASVTIPMDKLYDQIYANLRLEVLYLGGVFLALITCLGILIRVAVTGPLGRLGEGIGQIVHTGRFEEKIPQQQSRDEIGRLIVGFNEMIEHLREKTDHLEESEKRYRTLTETARDGIISFLSNGQIILFNRQAERMFGYSKAEILGIPVDQLIHEECPSIHETEIDSYMRQHEDRLTRAVHKLPCRRRDGSRFLAELSLSVAESDGHRFYTAILREKDEA